MMTPSAMQMFRHSIIDYAFLADHTSSAGSAKASGPGSHAPMARWPVKQEGKEGWCSQWVPYINKAYMWLFSWTKGAGVGAWAKAGEGAEEGGPLTSLRFKSLQQGHARAFRTMANWTYARTSNSAHPAHLNPFCARAGKPFKRSRVLSTLSVNISSRSFGSTRTRRFLVQSDKLKTIMIPNVLHNGINHCRLKESEIGQGYQNNVSVTHREIIWWGESGVK